ncbi:MULTISPECIES: helix-turn-helix domain-containing protein [unclassified Paenibacillus]|uniref:helix-turn-helix domain-containing protein n=1 Tax=unclassified Paenibacillus TaxID=185978 RepID=UPI0008380EBD|nr:MULTISPECIES: AraC family transcriptional regulator [unclassified Paenibacillus]NWL88103.1 AraC family transcriptional regulator [Paenibacillus sp. 79R4]
MCSHPLEYLLLENGFINCEHAESFNPAGNTYQLDSKRGQGYYWIYNYNQLFSILIHDFYFYEDFCIDLTLPELLTVTYYESISGTELDSKENKLQQGRIRCYWGTEGKYRAFINKHVPVRTIGIEYTPEFCNQFLKQKYGSQSDGLYSILTGMEDTFSFPELIVLLRQIAAYRGSSLASALFYEGKIYEAIALIIERELSGASRRQPSITIKDREQIQKVSSYIESHYSLPLSLEQLSKISYMSTTKLKQLFRLVHHCTITEYIQKSRIRQAEQLLAQTELSIHEIARSVGYQSAGRLSELFKRYACLTPTEYRQRLSGYSLSDAKHWTDVTQ